MPESKTALRDSYDVVVIGAGLGGMTAANRLAAGGRRVLLLERHHMLGGYATYFRRGPHIFDVALHAFPVGMAKTFRKYWSADIASRVVQLRRIRFENPQFSLRSTFETEDFLRILDERFGVPRETGEAFFRQCRSLNFYDDRHLRVRDLFDRFFPGNRPVRRLLLETVAYATGVNLDDPALCYGIVFSNFMQKGTYSLLGGTDQLLVDLRRELERNGVTIALRATAEKILFADGRAAGVRVNGRDIAARAVVSNANLKETALRLAGGDHIPPGLAEDIREAPLSLSVAQVYIGFQAGTELPDLGDILFTSEEPDFDDRASTVFPPPSRSYSIYYPRHLRPDHDRAEIVASARSRYTDWSGLPPDAYEAKKKVLIESVLADLERHFPGARRRIDHLEAATPVTLERYTGHWDGASFGTKFPGYLAADRLPKEVPGLYHTGSSGIIMSGWLGAANNGALVAAAVDQYLGD